jgi:hypothetical protein
MSAQPLKGETRNGPELGYVLLPQLSCAGAAAETAARFTLALTDVVPDVSPIALVVPVGRLETPAAEATLACPGVP